MKKIIDTVDADFRQGMKEAKKRLEKQGIPGPYSVTLSVEDALEAGVIHRQSVCGVRIFVIGMAGKVGIDGDEPIQNWLDCRDDKMEFKRVDE